MEQLLADLRPADREEAEALLGPGKVETAARESLARALLAWTAADAQGVVLIFGLGVVSILCGQGAPWMVGTARAQRYPRELVCRARPYIARMLEVCPVLCNVVDARNARSIAWLRRVGFTLLPAEPMGLDGEPFHPFYMEARHVP